MRLVSWNCCEGFDRKLAHLCDLDFDIAVVTEAGSELPPPVLGGRELSMVGRSAIPGQRKCIAVLAQAPWRVEAVELPVEQPWVVGARVSGPADFLVLAFWGLDPSWAGRSYASQAMELVRDVVSAIDEPVVIAGDFNAPVARTLSAHRVNVESLRAHGLLGVFESLHPGVDPMTVPTYFHRRKADEPQHIDHVFVPSAWTRAARLEVGTYAEWVATGRSDHVPVIVDLDTSALT